jgi:hypothetical protein
MSRVVLDAGPLIAVDRNNLRHLVELDEIRLRDAKFVTHPFVIAQVWRDSRRQARLAHFLRGVDTHEVDGPFGRRCGELLAEAGASDPNDAALVVLAHDGDIILTSDPGDIEQLVAASGKAVRVVPV